MGLAWFSALLSARVSNRRLVLWLLFPIAFEWPAFASRFDRSRLRGVYLMLFAVCERLPKQKSIISCGAARRGAASAHTEPKKERPGITGAVNA